MNIYQSILLGIVQGLTEFLPISSSAHLAFAQHYLGVEGSDLLFSLMVHFATAIAIFFYYRRDIYDILICPWGSEIGTGRISKHLLKLIIIAILPTALVAFMLQGTALKIMGDIRIVAILLLLTGLVVFKTDRIREKGIDILRTTLGIALIVGFAQGIAVLPGISRSGITIFTGLAFGLERSWAVKFSFLMSLPVIVGMTIVKIIMESGNMLIEPFKFFTYVVGSIFAGVVGYWAIRVVIRLIQQKHFRIFAIYCWMLGFFIILLKSLFS